MGETAVSIPDKPAWKDSAGKVRWNLMDWEALEDVAEVISNGATKYGDNNWNGLDPEDIWAALFRHISARRRGELRADDTGSTHIAHAIANLTFLDWFDRQREQNVEE
jgi:hypothetical protein